MFGRFGRAQTRMKAMCAAGFASLLVVMSPFSAGAVPSIDNSDPLVISDELQDVMPIDNVDNSDVETSTDEPQVDDLVDPEVSELETTDSVDPADAVEVNALDGLLAETNGLLNSLMATTSGDIPFTLDEPHIKWEVKAGDDYVGGATVEVKGPRTSTRWLIWETVSWGTPWTVKDCVADDGNCDGYWDQDPNPGKFAIAERKIGTGSAAIEHGEVFAIRPLSEDAPAGYEWVTPTNSWSEMSSNSNTMPTSQWPRSQPGYLFPTPLEVGEGASLTWKVTHNGMPVGGGIVELSAGGTSQTKELRIRDCVEAPCAPVSMDMDPEPGSFKVSMLYKPTASGFDIEKVSRSLSYTVTPADSPVGYSWRNESSISTSSVGGAGARYLGELPLQTASTMSWSVLGPGNSPVGNATVRVQQRSGWSWIGDYYVTDCAEAPCHPTSMDQDPRPGHFKLDSLREFDGTKQVSHQIDPAARYRVIPAGSINGYTWRSTSPVESSGSFQNGHLELPDLLVSSRASSSQVCVDPGTTYFSLERINSNGARILQLSYNSAETSINSSTNTVSNSSLSALVEPNQTPNALGVTPTGIFYFTGQIGNSDNTSMRNTTVYRFDPSVDRAPYPVFNMDLLSPTTGTVVSGDATVYQGREEFYYAYYSNSPESGAIRFHLYRYSHGNGARTGEVKHIDVQKPSDFGDSMNGDFSFDAQNNIQFIVSNHNGYSVSGSVNSQDFLNEPSAHSLPEVQTITGTGQASSVRGGVNGNSGINGVTYTANGRAIIQQSGNNRNSLVDLPSLNTTGSRNFTGRSLVDLAGCAKPTTVTVKKELTGDRVNADDQFQLNAERSAGSTRDQFASVTTTGGATGMQKEQVGPFVTTLNGTFKASETFVNANKEDYTTTWACYPQEVNGNLGEAFAHGEGTNLQFALSGSEKPAAVTPGSNLVCIFTNSPQREQLIVSKTSNPASGEAVNEEQIIKYDLVFDNSTGTLPAQVDHIDYLADVVDDAFFVDAEGNKLLDKPEVTVDGENLEAEWATTDTQLHIKGSVPASGKSTVSYQVKVKPNSMNIETRRSAENNAGFYVQNFLAKADVVLPKFCTSEVEEGVYCVIHPVNAWTIYKDSKPASGARLHEGGNAHYRLVAEKLTPQTTIDNLVITDDLTNVFKTAGFAPDAAVPGGALSRGVYFFDAQNNSLDATGDSTINADILEPGQAAYPGTDDSLVPTFNGERWILETQPLAVPKNAERVELWFAVEAGNKKQIPGTWPKNDSDIEQTPTMGSKFTNYVTATASQNPAVCVTGQVVGDPNASGMDPNFPINCQVTHELQANYFTIRKDAQGPGVDQVNLNEYGDVANSDYGFDKTGMWNMVGHKFEIRDNNNGQPSELPSVKLCRAEYNPSTGWDGSTWISDATNADWGENSGTLAAIKQWNNENPDNELPLCALIYEQGNIDDLGASTAGGQTGRWRSENLEAGEYWLVETKAPTHQINRDGKQKRAVPGVQLLAEPIAFTVWPDAEGESPSAGGAMYGRGQLDVSPDGSFTDWQERCIPGDNVGERPTACVNPTGYLMLVKDVTTITLPLSGGKYLEAITIAGSVLLVLAGIGIFVWRRRE
ncbi:hypothetical protein N24_2650 [Corynebacterium suranareeae]|uniref:Gram-positive cocci surface proteins LPxTG domain-containing protein n=1 Tax=Corynebacterium suranareeae TaxID=2506452 RepID=A0A161JPB5_9CORY|nr:hypothetical protein N24_2650 [Corynebacterium suranareeae]